MNNYQKYIKQKGAINILLVLLLAFIAALVAATIQSRLLLQISRTRSLSDILVADYNAESQLADILARLDYPDFTIQTGITTLPPLADGTEIQIENTIVDSIQTLLITAKRPFAVSQIEAVKETISSASIDNLEIALSLDCTSSMTWTACPTCKTTRMEELKKALDAFLLTLEQPQYQDKVKIGLSVFAMNAKWMIMRDSLGNIVEIKPDKNIPIAQIRSAINSIEYGFGKYGEVNDIHGSPACQIGQRLLPHTSIGTGLAFLRDYFKISPPPPMTKQVEILISDGEPTQRIPYNECYLDAFSPDDTSYCCPSGSNCNMTKTLSGEPGWQCSAIDPFTGISVDTTTIKPKLARDFSRCTMARTDQIWTSEYNNHEFSGIRNPDINLYSALTYDLPPTSPEYQIFQNYSTSFKSSADATKLSEFLQEFLKEITQTLTSIRITKVF